MTETTQPWQRHWERVPDSIPGMRRVFGTLSMLGADEDATGLLHFAARQDWMADLARVAATVSRLDTTQPLEPMHETLTLLYAASRVRDILLLAHQPAPADDAPAALDRALDRTLPQFRPVPLDQIADFFAVVGGRPVTEPTFDPVLHEIIACEPAADPNAPMEITAQAWPALLIGELVFTRAGVRVRAGSAVATPTVAAASTLHWEYWRRHRTTSDGSFFWGSNSQWSTAFRRDYRTDRGRVYDLDAFSSRSAEHRQRATGTSSRQPLSADQHDFIKNRCRLRVPGIPDFHYLNQGLDERP